MRGNYAIGIVRFRLVTAALLAAQLALSSHCTAQQLKNDKDAIKQAKEALKKRMGDVKFQVKESKGALYYTYTYEPPADCSNGTRGYACLEKENVVKAWKGIQTILKKYCEFKKGEGENNNYSQEIFDKKRPADILTGDEEGECGDGKLKACQRDASAPDIALTIPFVDQIMRIMVSSEDFAKNVQCGELFKADGSNMPDVPETDPQGTFDDCKKYPKKCSRNQVLYNAVRLIAASQTLHTAKFDATLLKNLNANVSDQAGLETLLANALEGVDIDTAIEENREMWVQFTNWLGKVAQGQASGSVFRPMISAAGSNQ